MKRLRLEKGVLRVPSLSIPPGNGSPLDRSLLLARVRPLFALKLNPLYSPLPMNRKTVGKRLIPVVEWVVQ